MKDWIVITLMSLGIVLLIAAGICVSYWYEKNISCPHFAANVGLESRYDFLGGGCFVKAANGQWVQDKNYYNAIPVSK